MSERPKSDYAIVLSCNPGYGFGMIATMNAMKYYGTNADWEVAYEGFTPEYREKVSNAFPFQVNWTTVTELMKTVVDKRTTSAVAGFNIFWLAYWLMADKLLKEKKYKTICVTQADQFTFVNLNSYFQQAERGMMFSSHYDFTKIPIHSVVFGDDKSIWDRGQCSFFDSVNFIGTNSKHTEIPRQTIEFQCEDAFRGEANHSVIALNRSIIKYGTHNDVRGLAGHLWGCDAEWGNGRYQLSDDGDRIYCWNGEQTCSWHSRWWQKGRAEGEVVQMRRAIEQGLDTDEITQIWDNHIHNYNLVKSFMERFNNMTPEIRSEEYLQGIIERPLRKNEIK
jgi:hypothetical protein